MKISIVRSGGFAGITMPAKTLETDDASIISLAKEAQSSAAGDKKETTGNDMMEYKIDIDGEVFSVSDQNTPDKARELIELVSKPR